MYFNDLDHLNFNSYQHICLRHADICRCEFSGDKSSEIDLHGSRLRSEREATRSVVQIPGQLRPLRLDETKCAILLFSDLF